MLTKGDFVARVLLVLQVEYGVVFAEGEGDVSIERLLDALEKVEKPRREVRFSVN